MEKLYGSWN